MTHRYDPNCPHCIPVAIDPKTMRPLSMAGPEREEMLRVWWAQPFAVREAFIEVTVNNSTDPKHLALCNVFLDECQKAQR